MAETPETNSISIRDQMTGWIVFIGVLWGVFAMEYIVPSLVKWGVVPRTTYGLLGIVSMPFLHGSFSHILSNTVPLLILLPLLSGSKPNAVGIVATISLGCGALLWTFGRPADHIGASGLVYGLIAYLILSGFLERQFISIVVSFVVLFLYGGSLLWGIIPSLNSNTSWDGHLCGMVAGGILAFTSSRIGARDTESTRNTRSTSLVSLSASTEEDEKSG
jgi:membrane associated rhomboid family serine protease